MFKVLVVVADETLTMLNSWDDQVGITEMVNQIGVIGPPKPDENEEEADMNSALTVRYLYYLISNTFYTICWHRSNTYISNRGPKFDRIIY